MRDEVLFVPNSCHLFSFMEYGVSTGHVFIVFSSYITESRSLDIKQLIE